MTQILEENIASKLGKWWRYFIPFYQDGGFDRIYAKLKEESMKGIVICPDSTNTFKSFESIDPDKVKVLWVLLDPYASIYNGVKAANGIAMDCSNRGVLQPSLKKFYEGIENCEKIKNLEKPASLSYLIEQGNMFFNTALTVPQGAKAGAHIRIWEEFMEYFYTKVMINFTGIIYVLCGRDSEKMEVYINSKANHLFWVEHPSAANHGDRDWKHDGIFQKINKIIKGANGASEQIIWNVKTYKEIKQTKAKSINEMSQEEIELLVGELPF